MECRIAIHGIDSHVTIVSKFHSRGVMTKWINYTHTCTNRKVYSIPPVRGRLPHPRHEEDNPTPMFFTLNIFIPDVSFQNVFVY